MEGNMLSWNLDHVFEEAEQKGIEKGIEKGKKEERIELVKRMLRANIDVKQISEISGLSLEEIKGLKE
jgi:predicted transposase/invertase (TIGR01784 family)